MKYLFILVTVLALAVARPELYKEQEDFQYSRSSSDDGTKSGYYDAQRGNMGGNYERAHNMDLLAQNQMSGLVRQIEGELGEDANTKAGNVYSSASSKGIYGSGHFDLSNLAGRNFHEGTYYDNLQSRSSLAQSSSMHNRNDYSNSHSQSYSNLGYRGSQRSDAQTQYGDLQSLDNLQGNTKYYDYGKHSSGFQSQAGFQEHGEYDHSNTNSHSGYGPNMYNQLIRATPVKVVLTPGGRVAIPVAAQTYNTAQASSAFDQNAQNSNFAIITDNNQGAMYKPSDAKHYESSYRYHKKWEKHDTIPTSISLVVPSSSAISKNSELLEDNEAYIQNNNRDSQNKHFTSASSTYNAVKSSSQSQKQLSSQRQSDSSSSNSNGLAQDIHSAGSNHGASSDSNVNEHAQIEYNFGAHSDLNSQVENLNTKPKSYQSSYAYHKSWERHGDPYVIKPASGGYYDSQASQRLSSSANNLGYGAYQSGSRYSLNQADCDENGHIRIARSSYTDNEDIQQQSQQQTILGNSDELVQQVQSTWQNLEDLSQQSHSTWEESVGQQSQSKWDNLADINQQSQNIWEQQNVQQSQNQLDSLNGLSQQSQNVDALNVEQQSQNKWNNVEDLSQSQSNWDQNVGQQTQNNWNNLEELGQQSQTNWEQQSVGQKSQNTWDKFEHLSQQSQKNWGGQSLEQNTPHQFHDITQQGQISDMNLENLQQNAQNFLGGGNKGIETEQNQYRIEHIKTETNVPAIEGKEHNDRGSHKVEIPWDKFGILDTYNKNKSNTENKIEANEFYWHHTRDNRVDNHQINKLSANDVLISDQEPDRHINSNPNSQHGYGYVAFDNNYNNPNVIFSHGNGFINPIIYNKRILNQEQQHLQTTHSLQEQGIDSTSNFRVNDYHSYLNDSKMSNFWNKFDKIEKESISSISKDEDSTAQLHTYSRNSKYASHQSDNNTNLMNSQSQTTFNSKNVSLNYEDLMGEHLKNENTPEQNSHYMLPQTNKNLESDIIDLPKDIESLDFGKPEKPQDIGRGDIGSDDFYSDKDVSDTVSTHYTTATYDIGNKNIPYNNITQHIRENNDLQVNGAYNKLSVLSLEQQNYQKQNNEEVITSHDYSNNSLSIYLNNVTRTVENQQVNYNKSHNEFEQNIGGVRQTVYTSNFQDTPNFIQDGVSSQTVRTSIQHSLQNLAHQNKNKQQNLYNIRQEHAHDSEQHYEKIEQNSQNFKQENIQDFGIQDHKIDQQNFHSFDQADTQDFVQQYENLEQRNLHNFEQETVQDIATPKEHIEPQHLYNFGRENLQEHKKDIVNLENQISRNPDQKIIQTSMEKMGIRSELHVNQHEENIQNFEKENHNSNGFQQENINDFWTEHAQDRQQYLQDFGQLNTPEFVLQKQNFEQQSLQKQYENVENIELLLQSGKLHQHYETSKMQQPVLPEIIDEQVGLQTQKQNKVETVVEIVTEKPGFWKSLGSKFSNAKDKVVTWFRS